MRRLKNIASNIFSSTTLFFVFAILYAYLFSTGILVKNRITKDSIIREKVHNDLLKNASTDYISSILWMNYTMKIREGKIVTDQIVGAINDNFGKDSVKLYKSLDLAINNGKSDITSIIEDITKPYGDKIVLYRHGGNLYLLSDDSYDNLLFVNPDDSVKRKIRKDVYKDILFNQSPNFQNFESFVYNVEPSIDKKVDFKTVLSSFADNNFDPSNLRGLMLCASYINWKKGLFGENLTLNDGEPNPNIRQIIVISKINISEVIMENPKIVKHINNFQNNSRAIDKTFESYNIFNIMIMVGNLLMAIMIGLTVMVQYDLENIKKATKRRRRNDDVQLEK